MVGGVTSSVGSAYLAAVRQPAAATADGRAGSFEKTESADAHREQAQLEQRDAEVRRHEQAHIAAGGQYVRGGAHFTYERGPDGRMYAVGGEVSIDVSPESTPEETIQKAEAIRRAALAPGDPSAQDRAVAAKAAAMEAEARRQMSAAYGAAKGTAKSGAVAAAGSLVDAVA
jgi:hypothetical protein